MCPEMKQRLLSVGDRVYKLVKEIYISSLDSLLDYSNLICITIKISIGLHALGLPFSTS